MKKELRINSEFHGFYSDEKCRSDEGGRSVAGIVTPFDGCGSQRIRSLNPRGIFVLTTVVITFHPHFVTKVDRAYRVSCFYMEASKDVVSQLAVSELTTSSVTAVVLMPTCRYDVSCLGLK
ncbi:unnamed protein product [Heligmosomoides polygyrus]|uniref:ZP domain-containing protein n=1 Tax=Heligmosomoides polygyrus TaxID=6339 RepID=A0A3P8J8V2_HELPZ|nr:unnamed protein product [Heligmosomoides polygyrus]